MVARGVVRTGSIIAAFAFSLSSGGREEALFALSSTPYAGRLVWVIDGPQVTADFPTAAGDLIETCKLRWFLQASNGKQRTHA